MVVKKKVLTAEQRNWQEFKKDSWRVPNYGRFCRSFAGAIKQASTALAGKSNN